jgi:hypothetical protein
MRGHSNCQSTTAYPDAGDRIGMWASLTCAIHCALWPLALLMLPAAGLAVLPWADIDQIFVLFATVLGLTMVSLGFRRHRAFAAWVLLLAGLALVWANAFTPLHEHAVWHAIMMATGGGLIAAAHLVNRRAVRCAPKSLVG